MSPAARDILLRVVGGAIDVARDLLADDWDDEQAIAVLRGRLARPPKRALSDEDRERLRRIAERG